MVADYHGYYEPQDDVAAHMGIYQNVGCTFGDQHDYFFYYLNFNSFSSYGSVPWDDYRAAIGDEYSANHKPVIDEIITSIGYHDRVAAGWAYYTDGTKSLEIYDPAPVNVGQITTEFFTGNHPFAGFAEP